VGITNSNTKAAMPQPVIMTCSCGMIKNKVRYNFCQNVANYIKKKLYKINEKELKEILSELTEYLKENKPVLI
jgi:hypothetical protein